MARYIDCDKAVSYFENHRRIGLHKDDIVAYLSSLPTADVEEVKNGYWKHSVEFGFAAKYHYWNCSVCGVASEDEGKEKYCRECGAKMDGGKEE